MTNHSLDKKQLRRGFDRAANTYDEFAMLSQEVGNRMLERLDLIKIEPEIVLDLGSGTGYFTKALQERYPESQIISADVSFLSSSGAAQLSSSGLTGGSRSQIKSGMTCVGAWAEHLPLKDQSIDFIFANMLLPFCDNLPMIFSEIRRVLKPEGLFLFSSLGPDTLIELRSAWAQVDDKSHVHVFYDMHDVGDQMLAAGFADPVMDVEQLTFMYQDVKQLCRELKNTGMQNALISRSQTLTLPSQFQKMEQAYEGFKTNNKIPATFEIIQGHAWGKEVLNQQRNSDEFVVSLEELRRKL